MRRYLTPRMLGAHLLALVCTAAAMGLGVWQLSAWQASRTAEAIDLSRSAPVALVDLMQPDDPFPGLKVGQPVTLEGTWVPDGTVYIAGRQHDGRDGYWVVTPLTTGAADAAALPVVRGWVARPDLAPAPPSGSGAVEGLLQPSEGTGAFDDDPLDDVFPQLRTADLVQRSDNDLYSGYAVLTAGAPGTNTGAEGLVTADVEQLPPPGQFTAVRNLLYAIEWWFFGAFAVFIWWRFVTEKDVVVEATRPDDRPDPAGRPDQVDEPVVSRLQT